MDKKSHPEEGASGSNLLLMFCNLKVVRDRVGECVGEHPVIYLEMFSQELVPIRIGRASNGFQSGDILTSTAPLTTTVLNQTAQCFCLDCTLRR